MTSNPMPQISSKFYPSVSKASNFWTGGASSYPEYRSSHTINNNLGTPSILYPYNNTAYLNSMPVPAPSPPIGQLNSPCKVGPLASGPFSYRDR